ncbi:MAG: DNA helicase RecQ [Spirochaetales bacterium]|nr:DNA helicase RecQ [Spirochaetales bacterium]
MTADGKQIRQTLANVFGFASFRENQEEITTAILKGRDVFAAMPTGGGKSLCYQLPALILPGVAVVVSPLISLMKDQVDAARESGIAAAYLNSSQTPAEYEQTRASLVAGEIKLLYLSPERVALKNFSHNLRNIAISLIAVDEAHCLSEWGHDFRPDYLQLANLRDMFPGIPLAAFTATATKRVQSDIITILRLDAPYIVRASFNRKELFYRVERKEKVLEQIASYIVGRPGESGIVYRTTRKDVENTVAHLKAAGISAAAYHAGLNDAVRREAQDMFNRDEIRVIVATVAFGMGIDKSNIRYIVHGDLPRNIESYYQETGRAGRDGENADCLLLFSRGDAAKVNYFIQKMASEAEIAKASANLEKILSFCAVHVCRRKQLLQYFDEHHPGNCGRCDVCTGQTETEDVTKEAQIFLSAVVRTGERFGVVHILDIVRGADNAKIRKFGHDSIITWGAGKDKSRIFWSRLADELAGQQHIYRDANRYNAVRLTESGRQLLFGKSSLVMAKGPEKDKQGRKEVRFAADETEYDQDLFTGLKALRLEIARVKKVPPYIIFSDKSLRQMSAYKPVTMEQFLQISGVGEKKAEQYGEVFMKVIKASRDAATI